MFDYDDDYIYDDNEFDDEIICELPCEDFSEEIECETTDEDFFKSRTYIEQLNILCQKLDGIEALIRDKKPQLIDKGTYYTMSCDIL